MTAAHQAHIHTQTDGVAAPATPPARYVRVPTRLLSAAAYQPAHIGVYSLVARLYLVAQAPVPLSAADITRYDPSLSRGAAQRALHSIVSGGWLIAHERAGQKTTYVPAWGRVSGQPLPWQIGAPCLGRPRHVRAICLDLRLLDLFLGKLMPHPKRAAIITRYVTTPLLALVDVGSYALLLGGLPGRTPSLAAWGLERHDQPLPLLDDATILAHASQRVLHEKAGAALTTSGLQKIGLMARQESTNTARPLFFVPLELIDNWPTQLPTNLIESRHDQDRAFVASESQNQSPATPRSGITWESMGTTRTKEESPPYPPNGDSGGGLSENHVRTESTRASKRSNQVQPQSVAQTLPPDTEAARALTMLHVLPDQVSELADTPIAVVRDAIRDGQARPYVRDLAGWVVTLIRAHRTHGWDIRPPLPRPDSPDALQAYFVRRAAEQEAERTHEQREEEDTAGETAVARTPPVLVAGTLNAQSAPAHIWNHALDTLKWRLPRHAFTSWLRHTRLVAIQDGSATIAVPNIAIKDGLEQHANRVLCDVLGELIGAPIAVRFVIGGSSAPQEDASRSTDDLPDVTGKDPDIQPNCTARSCAALAAADLPGRPDWIGVERWATLPAMLRAALLGATLAAGTVHATSPQLTRLLETRYASAIQSLVAEAEAIQ